MRKIYISALGSVGALMIALFMLFWGKEKPAPMRNLLACVQTSPSFLDFEKFIKYNGISSSITRKEKEVIFSGKWGEVTFFDGTLVKCLLIDKMRRIPAYSADKAKAAIAKEVSPEEMIHELGMPTIVDLSSTTTDLIYLFDIRTVQKLSQGGYHTSIAFHFKNKKITNCSFSLVSSLDQKNLWEAFYLE